MTGHNLAKYEFANQSDLFCKADSKSRVTVINTAMTIGKYNSIANCSAYTL